MADEKIASQSPSIDWDAFAASKIRLSDLAPVSAPPSKKQESSVLADTGLGLAKGVVSAVQSVSGAAQAVVGADPKTGFIDEGLKSAEDYLQSKKSDLRKKVEQELSSLMQDDSKGISDVMEFLRTNPSQVWQMAVESLPSMAMSMTGAGAVAKLAAVRGLIANGGNAAALIEGGIAGASEGVLMGGDVYNKTESQGAALAALGVGVVTGPIAGNLTSAVVKRAGGRAAAEVAPTAVPGLLSRAAGGATPETITGRVVKSMGGEAVQEGIQETSQALIEQAGLGQDYNLTSATKQGAVGAVVGAATGGGLHPFVGEGSPEAERKAALAAEIDRLAAQRAAADPQTQNAIDSQIAATVANNTTPAERAVMADEANVAGSQGMMASTTTDGLLQTFQATQQTQSDLRTGPAAADAAGAVLQASYDEATAEVPTETAAPSPEALAERANMLLAPAQDNLDAAVNAARGAGVLATSLQTLSQLDARGIFALEAQPLGLTPEQTQVVSALADIYRMNDFIAGGMVGTEPTVRPAQVRVEPVVTPTQAAPAQPAQTTAPTQPTPAQTTAPTQPVQQLRYGTPAAVLEAHRADLSTGQRAALEAFVSSDAATPHTELAVAARVLMSSQRPAAIAQSVWDSLREHVANRTGVEVDRSRNSGSSVSNMITQGRPLLNVLDNISNRGTPVGRILADKLREFGSNNPVMQQAVTWIPDAEVAAADRAGHRGRVAAAGGNVTRIQMNPNKATESAILHEAVHALTLSWYNRAPADNALKVELVELFNHVKAFADANPGLVTAGAQYGLTNPAEFLAEGFARAEFQEFLRQVPARNNLSVWASFVEWVSRVLGIPEESTGALADVMHIMPAITSASARAARTPPSSQPASPTTTTTTSTQPAQPAARVTPTPVTTFADRARTALSNGTLDKLAAFWNGVMGGQGQISVTVNISDLVAGGMTDANRATVLEKVRTRYNQAIHAKAVAWAKDNEEAAPDYQDTIISISHNGGRFTIRTKGLSRTGNPFYARSSDSASATMDSSLHTTDLGDAPGSGDIVYRVFADIAKIKGQSLPSDSTLLTNNNIRRMWQTVASDLRLGSGVITPITGMGNTGPQGVPADIWRAATPEQRVGLDILRLTHQVLVDRDTGVTAGQSVSRAAALDNLEFKSDGTFKAVRDPKPGGFARGEIATLDDIQEKLVSLGAVGGNDGRDAWLRGVGPTTAAFAIISQTVLNAIENNPDATIPATLTTAARRTGRESEGWFFSQDKAPGAERVTAIEQQTRELMDEHLSATNERRAEINQTLRELNRERTDLIDKMFAEESGYVYSADEPPINPDGTLTPAAEQAVGAALVTPAHPDEMLVGNRSMLTWFGRVSEKLDEVFRDKNATLRRVLTVLGVTGEQLKIDAMGALDRMPSRLQDRYDRMVKEPMARIENILHRAGVDRATMDRYLVLRHAPERNAYTAQINPREFNLTDAPGSGVTTETAIAELAELQSGKDGKALADAVAIYDEMIRSYQDFAVETGLESQEKIDAWRERFKFYTPFQRDLNIEENLSSFGGGQGVSIRAGISRRAMGSLADIISPLASTLMLGQKVTHRGETARVSRTMYELGKLHAPVTITKSGERKPMWKLDVFPSLNTVKRVNVYQIRDGNTAAMVTNANGSPLEFYSQSDATAFVVGSRGGAYSTVSMGPQNRVMVTQNPNYIQRDNVLIIPVNGENHAMVFDESSEDAMAIVHNLKGLKTHELNAAMKVMGAVSNWTVATSTGHNPMFAPFNFMRDVQAAAVNMNADAIPGWKASDTTEFIKSSFSNVPKLRRHLAAKFAQLHSNAEPLAAPARGTPEWWMEQTKMNGGTTGIRESVGGFEGAEVHMRRLYGETLSNAEVPANVRNDALYRAGIKAQALGDSISEIVEGANRKPGAKQVGNVLVFISQLNEATELATRTAAFKMATEKFMAAGKSEADAMLLAGNIAKNISINFNRRGQLSGVMNAMFPFFNAAMQGTARLAETVFAKQVVTDAATGAKLTETVVTPFGKKLLLALPAMGAIQALMLWFGGYDDEEPQSSTKERNLVIPLGGGQFASIPLALGLNVPFNLGREMMDTLLRPDHMGKHAMAALALPITGFNPLGSAGNTLLSITPAALDPFVALYTNKDAFGKTIAKEDIDANRPTPGFTRYKEGTSGLARSMAEAINWATGGTDERQGMFSPTPDQIEYTAGVVTGQVGREVGKAATLISRKATGVTGGDVEETPWYKVPGVGRLTGNINEPANIKSKLYEFKKELNELDAERKGMLKRGAYDEATRLMQDNPQMQLRTRLNRFLQDEADARKDRATARDAGDLARVNEITARLDADSLALLEQLRGSKR